MKKGSRASHLLPLALVVTYVAIPASLATTSGIRRDQDSNLVLDAADKIVRLLGSDVHFGVKNKSLSVLASLVASMQAQISMQASVIDNLERNVANLRGQLNATPTCGMFGTPTSPAFSAAHLYAAGANWGQNYYILINGVATLVTLRVLNGIAFGVSPTPLTYTQVISNWLYSGNGFYRDNFAAVPATLQSDPVLSAYNYTTLGWTSVSMDSQYVSSDGTYFGWYVRSPPFYISGSFSYSGAVDDNEAWSLIPYPNTGNSLVDAASDSSANGGVSMRCGCNAHAWTNRLVTCNPGVYIWAGRGLQGIGDAYLKIQTVEASKFFAVLSL